MPRCFAPCLPQRVVRRSASQKTKKKVKNNQRENLPRKAPNWVARTADIGSNSRIGCQWRLGERGGWGVKNFTNETGRCFRSHHPMSFLRRKRSTSHAPRAACSTVHHCTSLCASHLFSKSQPKSGSPASTRPYFLPCDM